MTKAVTKPLHRRRGRPPKTDNPPTSVARCNDCGHVNCYCEPREFPVFGRHVLRLQLRHGVFEALKASPVSVRVMDDLHDILLASLVEAFVAESRGIGDIGALRELALTVFDRDRYRELLATLYDVCGLFLEDDFETQD